MEFTKQELLEMIEARVLMDAIRNMVHNQPTYTWDGILKSFFPPPPPKPVPPTLSVVSED